jgi:hypothetical protein
MNEPTAEKQGQKMPTLKTKQGEISKSRLGGSHGVSLVATTSTQAANGLHRARPSPPQCW